MNPLSSRSRFNARTSPLLFASSSASRSDSLKLYPHDRTLAWSFHLSSYILQYTLPFFKQLTMLEHYVTLIISCRQNYYLFPCFVEVAFSSASPAKLVLAICGGTAFSMFSSSPVLPPVDWKQTKIY